MMKKIRRSKTDRKLAGVCGGLGESLGMDAGLVRLLWVVSAVMPFITIFGAVVAYIACAILIPEEEDYIDV